MATLTLYPAKIKPLEGAIISAKDAGEATKVGKLVYVAADGMVYETDAASAAKVSGNIGMVVSGGRQDPEGDVAAGERVGVLWFGRVALNGTTLDMTKQYYCANVTSTVKGLIGDAAGTVTRRVGAAESATVLFFNPDTSGASS